MTKHPDIENLLNCLAGSKNARAKAKAEQRCLPSPVGCGTPATFFRDELSVREYNISRLCQECQDKVFNSLFEEL